MKIKLEPSNLKPKQARRKAVLKELEKAFAEAKEIKDGKKQAIVLEEIFLVQ